ncbi:hypothetical protein HYV83_00255 [Candidatus Woesearchaeota archaeon]|nr:hypothetical protein [Candidatus Woesearchaeota archaeon]
MRNNDAFVLWLVVALFLFLVTIPVLAFAFYFKILPLPQLDYGSIAAVAAAGLLVVPLIFVLIAVVALASARKREFIPKPRHYPWEGVFKQKEFAAAAAAVVVPRKKLAVPVDKPKSGAGIKAVAVVAVVVLALVALSFFTSTLKEFSIFVGANETANETRNVSAITTANISEKVPVANVSKINISAFFRKVFAARNETAKVAHVKAAEKTEPADFGKAFANVRSSIGRSVADIKSSIGKVPYNVWQSVAAAVLAVVLATTVFLSHRTGQLGEVVLWVKGWVVWLFSLPSAIMRNKLKSLVIALAVAVVCGGVAAFVFRNKLANLGGFAAASRAAAANLPSNAGPAIFGLLISVRNFLFVYRLYIFIGIFVLLVVIGILYMLERKGRK